MCAEGISGGDGTSSGDGFGLRLAEILSALGDKSDQERKSGMSEKTLSRWVKRETAAPFEAIARLAAEAGYSLDWIASGMGTKLRRASGSPAAAERIVRDRAEAIYDEILREISGFLDRRSWRLTQRRRHQLAEEFLDYVIRYDEADTRAAVLEVLVETRIPVVYEEQTAHEKIGPPSGRPCSEPPKEPAK